MNTMQTGTRIYFGRTHGEKTLGEIIKVNGKSVKVKQLESRGSFKDHKVGTIWRVALSLCSPAEEGIPAITARPVAPATVAHPAGSRPEAAILQDIRRVYNRLSPENLSCDGELGRTAVARRRAIFSRELKALFKELGRPVCEDEAFRSDGD